MYGVAKSFPLPWVFSPVFCIPLADFMVVLNKYYLMYGVAKSDDRKHSFEDKIWKLESESGNLYQKPQREQNDTLPQRNYSKVQKLVR